MWRSFVLKISPKLILSKTIFSPADLLRWVFGAVYGTADCPRARGKMLLLAIYFRNLICCHKLLSRARWYLKVVQKAGIIFFVFELNIKRKKILLLRVTLLFSILSLFC